LVRARSSSAVIFRVRRWPLTYASITSADTPEVFISRTFPFRSAGESAAAGVSFGLGVQSGIEIPPCSSGSFDSARIDCPCASQAYSSKETLNQLLLVARHPGDLSPQGHSILGPVTVPCQQ